MRPAPGLEAIHFLYGDKADALMHALRHLIGRAGPTAMEVGVLHGLARQMEWVGSRAQHGMTRDAATRVFEGGRPPSAPLEDSGRGVTGSIPTYPSPDANTAGVPPVWMNTTADPAGMRPARTSSISAAIAFAV